jgi:hypothetical protein
MRASGNSTLFYFKEIYITKRIIEGSSLKKALKSSSA